MKPPSTAEDDDWNPEPRRWKKQAHLMWDNLNMHRFASTFSQTVGASDAANYNSVVRKPTDLIALKRTIENGAVRNVFEMHRDALLMLLNATMYNSSDSELYPRAAAMAKDVENIVAQFKNTQLLLKTTPSTSASSSSSSRRRGGGGDSETSSSRKRSAAEDASGGSTKKRRK